MISIQPLSDVLGARIEGVDLSLPLSATDFKTIEAALHQHCFIIFPRQTLTAPQFPRVLETLGACGTHVIDTFHHPEIADILVLSNVEKDGKPTGLKDAGTYFHSTIPTWTCQPAAPCCMRCRCRMRATAPPSPTSLAHMTNCPKRRRRIED